MGNKRYRTDVAQTLQKQRSEFSSSSENTKEGHLEGVTFDLILENIVKQECAREETKGRLDKNVKFTKKTIPEKMKIAFREQPLPFSLRKQGAAFPQS